MMLDNNRKGNKERSRSLNSRGMDTVRWIHASGVENSDVCTTSVSGACPCMPYMAYCALHAIK